MRLAALAAALAMTPTLAAAADKDTRVFEMRTYHAAPGKLEALHARFKNHTLKLFEKHGITNVAYFTPADEKDTRLVFVLAYPTREAREKSWTAFLADPAWVKAKDESEKDGTLVEKVEQRFLATTDYSPPLFIETKGDRVFELRVYTATKGHLPNLNDRFKDHTIKLFEKHGMTNIVYWTPTADQPDKDTTLVYLLAHKSQAEAKKSFAAFGADPAWQAARKASEEKAGGSLTEKGGVVSLFLKPTDYSPLK